MEDRMNKAIENFNKYTEKFDLNNEMLKRKYYHTFRVAEYSKDIARGENLDENELYLAFVCGLLHDIARFKQGTEYGTYVDALSFDHGNVGYEILKENNYIEQYVDNEEEKQIILKAVKNHNKFKIEEGLSEKELYFAKLIRDADKIDIMDLQKNEILDNDYSVPEEAIKAMNEKRSMIRENDQCSDVTWILVIICFIFDINYRKSFEIIEEKKIIRRKLELLKRYIDIDKYEFIEKSVLSKLKI